MEDSSTQSNQQPGQTITPTTGSAAQPPANTADNGTPSPAPTSPEPPAPPPEPSEPPAAPPTPPEPAVPPTPPAEPQTPPEESPEPPAPAPAPEESDQSEEEAKFYTSQLENTDEPDSNLADADAQPITWTASEFIAHAKSSGWYAALALATAALVVLIFLITRDPVSVGVIIFGAIIFGIYAGHKPHELEYRLDNLGLSIGQKHFGYGQFRCFSVLPEGGISSIVFMPLKRFALPTTIYYPPEDEDKIISLLGSRLPLEERGHDAIDRLMHRIHF